MSLWYKNFECSIFSVYTAFNKPLWLKTFQIQLSIGNCGGPIPGRFPFPVDTKKPWIMKSMVFWPIGALTMTRLYLEPFFWFLAQLLSLSVTWVESDSLWIRSSLVEGMILHAFMPPNRETYCLAVLASVHPVLRSRTGLCRSLGQCCRLTNWTACGFCSSSEVGAPVVHFNVQMLHVFT